MGICPKWMTDQSFPALRLMNNTHIRYLLVVTRLPEDLLNSHPTIIPLPLYSHNDKMPYYSRIKLPALHTRSFMPVVLCNQKFQYFGLKWWQLPLSGLMVVQNRFESELDLMESVATATEIVLTNDFLQLQLISNVITVIIRIILVTYMWDVFKASVKV